MANETVTPAVVNLVLTISDVTFLNSGDMKLVFSSEAPSLIEPISVGGAALSVIGDSLSRGYGLQLQSDVLTVGEALANAPSVGSLTISGRIPQPLVEAPPSHTIGPEAGQLSLVSVRPIIDHSASPGTASASLVGVAPAANVGSNILVPTAEFVGRIPAPAAVASLQFQVQQEETEPDAVFIPESAPTILLEFVGGTGGQDGVVIKNTDATTDNIGKYEMCSRTNFKQKVGTLVQDGYGDYVRADSAEPRHPQERLLSKKENFRDGAERPEPASDTFLADNEVKAEDL